MTAKIRFTSAVIAALPLPASGSKLYHDVDTRWHAVRVFATGERTFYVYRKIAGKPAKVLLGVFDPKLPASREIPKGTDPLEYIGNRPSLNPRMAQTLAAAVNVELSKGINPSDVARTARRKREGELTLAQAFDRYEADHLRPYGKRSAADLRHIFERYIGAMPAAAKKPHGRQRRKSPYGVDWSQRRLSSVQKRDIRGLMVALKDGHGTSTANGASTANRTFELVRTVYNKMIEWKLYDGANPCTGIPKFAQQSRDRFLRGDELPAFFAALNALPEGAFKDFVQLATYTGARRANLLGARWPDIDLDAGLWTIPGKASKSGRAMTLPLTRRALEVLTRRRKGDPDGVFVFPAESATGHMVMPKKKWSAFVKSAGLADFTLHDLRRSAGSWAAMTGASLPIIGKALGHRSSASTEIYARLQVDPVLAALSRAQDAMAAAGGERVAEVHDMGKRRRSERGRR
ncbi:MAG: tyrosine-type recombinase/integrase [Casimicrobiaceae bacterium]